MDDADSDFVKAEYIYIVNAIKADDKTKRTYTVGLFTQVHYAVYIAEQEVEYRGDKFICNVMKMPVNSVIEKQEQVEIVYVAKPGRKKKKPPEEDDETRWFEFNPSELNNREDQ